MYHISDDKRSRESSGVIYDALAALIWEKDYDKIKINELCQRAKLGRVTFYRHYDTIEDVLRKKLQDHLQDFSRYLAEYKRDNPLEIGIFKPLLRYFYVHPAIIRLIFKSRQLHILKEGMEDFFVSLNPELSGRQGDYLTVIRVSVFVGILEKWVSEGMNIPPDDLVASVKENIRLLAMERLGDM